MTNIIRMIATADTLLSDMHKDAYGFRPRDVYPDFMCENSLRAEYDRLQDIICDDIRRENAAALRAQRRFENLIAKYQSDFGIDRATALRWYWDAEGYAEDGDVGYWCYKTGVSYMLDKMYLQEFRDAGLQVWAS